MKLTWYGHSAFRVEAERRQDLDRPLSHRQSVCGARAGRGQPKASRTCSSLMATATISAMRSRSCRRPARCSSPIPRFACFWPARGVGQNRDQPGQSRAARSIAAASPPLSSMRCILRPIRAMAAQHLSRQSAGLVLHFPDDKTLYHMGDTDIFSDMALINELHEPEDRPRADRRPLHHGRRGGGARLPAASSSSRPACRATTGLSGCSTKLPTSSLRQWRDRA